MLAGDNKRGWVFLWGYGKERAYPSTYPRVLARLADPLFDDIDAEIDHYLARVAVTPVLLWNPKDSNPYGYVRYLFDTDKWTETGNWPVYNLFCAGHAFLSDGRLFMAGGDSDLWTNAYPSQGEDDVGYVGLRLAAIFHSGNFHPANTLTSQPLWYANHPMSEPRWYPMVTALPDGRLLIVGGTRWGIEGGLKRNTEMYEVYDPCENTFIDRSLLDYLPQVQNALGTNYPRLQLISYVSNGVRARIVYTGPFLKTYWMDAFNPTAEYPAWYWYGNQRSVERHWGSSVLLPNTINNPSSLNQQTLNKVIVMGGNNHDSGVTKSSEILTFSTGGGLTIESGPNMHHERMHLNAVLLPSDEILVFGGIRMPANQWIYPDHVVYPAELYTKNAFGVYTWKEVASNLDTDVNNDGIRDGTRVYHSTGLLLPNGKVLTVGSATRDNSTPPIKVENHVPTIYTPPYLFKAGSEPGQGVEREPTERPQILSVSDPLPETPDVDMNYGQNFTLSYQLHEGSGGVRSVVLIRPASVTHSFNSEQRLVKLRFVVNSGSELQVTAPWHQGVAPPGWYMLFLVSNDGVPSEAQWVRVKLTDCYTPEGGAMMFSFEDLAPSLSEEQRESWEMTPITVELRDPETGDVAASYTLSFSAPEGGGTLSWTVPADHLSGGYELYVAPYRSWLGKRVPLDWQRDELLSVSLINGDVNGDNRVDALDLEIVLSQMGSQDSAVEQTLSGDLNADGVVDTQDIDILLANFGAQGDQ